MATGSLLTTALDLEKLFKTKCVQLHRSSVLSSGITMEEPEAEAHPSIHEWADEKLLRKVPGVW